MEDRKRERSVSTKLSAFPSSLNAQLHLFQPCSRRTFPPPTARLLTQPMCNSRILELRLTSSELPLSLPQQVLDVDRRDHRHQIPLHLPLGRLPLGLLHLVRLHLGLAHQVHHLLDPIVRLLSLLRWLLLALLHPLRHQSRHQSLYRLLAPQ